MLILLNIITIFAIIISLVKGEEKFVRIFVAVEDAIIIITILIAIIFPYNIDKKIEIYIEENQMIEIKIKNTVKGFIEYEKETFITLVDKSDVQTLLLKYPELNSNELVKMEIETYKENSEKIKQLKEVKIDKKVMAWWFYFGS